ncbi:MAG: sulfite exporter TauE/SafE family protein [Candidatus Zambryskibacteria bacterium]
MPNKTYTFHVHNMHCQACVLLTESELIEHPKVSSAKSSLKTQSVEICGDFENMTPSEIAKELTGLLSEHSLSMEKQIKNKNWSDFKIAIPIALAFVVLFVALQKMGIVNLVNASNGVSYGTAFVIGIIASLSTCMAVVGGLLLSMSATFASTSQELPARTLQAGRRGASKVKPIFLFHIGRIISFFILGGVIGAIGSAFQLGTLGTFILGIIIGLVMLVLGLNLLDIFHFTKKFQPSMPKFLSRHALGISKLNHSLTPFLVGIATFFLPCGFTQSMQIFTLSTGNFMQGGLTMLSFALGTLPILALVSFSSFSIKNSSKSGIFFKSAGLIVIMFALFNIINSLVVIGLVPPVFSF